ncbi:MAG: hypothetical protein NC084_13435 [Bacteroides sp.]|nr:hypothetical protein [Eubacterium sp.]MCM1418953.1 hypothetical protein [Roseburia sp.]MCM1463698.1 hypothetical protein [Bacteroides sp.]
MKRRFGIFFAALCLLIGFTANGTVAAAIDSSTAREYAALYRAGDEAALRELIEESFIGYGFPEETLQMFRDQTDAFIAIDFEPDSYYMAIESSFPKINWNKYRFDFITDDGSVHTVLYTLWDGGTFYRSLKSIVHYSGIEDPERIIFASGTWLDGAMVFTDFRMTDAKPGWNDVDGNRVYLQKNGFTATKSTTIDGVRYKFDENSVCQGTYTGFTSSDKGRRYWKTGRSSKTNGSE